MKDESYVRSETQESVCTIEFFHPQGNSLPSKMLNELAQEIRSAGENPHARVIILRSAGTRAFCGGASFDELSSLRSEEEGIRFFSGFAQVINAMRNCPKLIIARVHGKSVGGGVGIIAAADYAIAFQTADVKLSELSIGFGPFVIAAAVERKIGTAAFGTLAIDAGSWRNAQWALNSGLFSEMHRTVEDMDASVSRLATRLSAYSADAMSALKQVLWEGTGQWSDLLAERAAISGRLAQSVFARTAIDQIKNG